MLGDIFKRKGVVVGSILFGTLIGGSIGVYIRDNWDIEARVGLKYKSYILISDLLPGVS